MEDEAKQALVNTIAHTKEKALRDAIGRYLQSDFEVEDLAGRVRAVTYGQGKNMVTQYELDGVPILLERPPHFSTGTSSEGYTMTVTQNFEQLLPA